uniref:(northern house mosquito) hypothetical protein n=1 Tax=Culex pipiens TaxID=7175 RepID=A0A8D8BS97_CULPI
MKFLTIVALIAVTLGAVLAANTAAINGKSAAVAPKAHPGKGGLKALNATKLAELSQKFKTLKLKYPNFARNVTKFVRERPALAKLVKSAAPKVTKVTKN